MSIATRPVDEEPERLRRREQRGWMFYDWANSAYATTVIAVFIGPYLNAVAKNAACARQGLGEAACDDARKVPLEFLGITLNHDSWFPYVLGLSILVQVVVLPVTGAIADRSQRKVSMLAIFAYVGSVATLAMYLVHDGRFALGWLLYLVANMAFGASIVVYNSFLVDIAAPAERDRVSARGWALGYLGGGVLLALNLVLYGARDSLGLSEGDAVRLSLASAGAWWAVFTVIPLRALRGRRTRSQGVTERPGSVLRAGFSQLRHTLAEARGYPRTLHFLAAYLVYNDGIQSVIALAAVYAVDELQFEQSTVIVAILLVQFVAFAGALALGRLAARLGATRVILASLALWAVVVMAAFFLPAEQIVPFLLLAAGIGFVLGGSQALSRSLYSQLIPRGREAEYFSLYEISERGTSWLGAVLFATVNQLTGSYRWAIVSLVVFFLAGFLLLARLDVRRGIREAGNVAPDLV
jgi:UMF1 family MFS transporter